MTEQEQIEEMVADIKKALDGNIDLVERKYVSFEAEFKYHGMGINFNAVGFAEALYNAGYRKVGEKFCLKHSEKDYYLTEEDAKGEKACEDCREQVRKETAKEIYKLLLGTEHIKELEQKEHCEWWVSRWRIEDLNRVFKAYGVEIEE